jgi:hypothetical protein
MPPGGNKDKKKDIFWLSVRTKFQNKPENER